MLKLSIDKIFIQFVQKPLIGHPCQIIIYRIINVYFFSYANFKIPNAVKVFVTG
jgi:hypothetical protein